MDSSSVTVAAAVAIVVSASAAFTAPLLAWTPPAAISSNSAGVIAVLGTAAATGLLVVGRARRAIGRWVLTVLAAIWVAWSVASLANFPGGSNLGSGLLLGLGAVIGLAALLVGIVVRWGTRRTDARSGLALLAVGVGLIAVGHSALPEWGLRMRFAAAASRYEDRGAVETEGGREGVDVVETWFHPVLGTNSSRWGLVRAEPDAIDEMIVAHVFGRARGCLHLRDDFYFCELSSLETP